MNPILSAAARREPLRVGPVLAIASGKGGVGKTWFSITLAHAIARHGARALIFDGDLGLANVDVQLGLLTERDLSAVLSGRISMADAAIRVAGAGFDAIAGHSGSGSLSRLPPERIQRLARDIRAVATRYDWVVLDLGAGIDGPVRELAGAADTCLVLCTDEPTSLTDAYAFIKVFKRESPTADLRVVVNQAKTADDGERTYATLRRACESFLRFAPLCAGIVRRDPLVAEAIRHQSPLLTRHPNSPAAADVEAIARALLRGP